MKYEQQLFGTLEIMIQKNQKKCMIEHEVMQEKING
jgi:hypothetical protein